MDPRVFVILGCVLLSIGCSAAETRLPIVTGNLSVYHIQHSPVGAFPDPSFAGDSIPPASEFERLHKEGLNAYEDYVAWGAVEIEPGKWDWSRHIEMADNQRSGGMEYDPYLWIHNPPAWMRSWTEERRGGVTTGTRYGIVPGEPDAPDRYTLMKCLEHGEETYTFSIWDPATLKWFGRFYREMREGMGDRIGRTYVGLVGPYGEGNYPLPMFDWLKIGHCHEGYWCGDKYARREFIRTFRNRYRTLRALNEAWGTDFARWEEVTYPPEIAEGKIRKAEDRTDPRDRRRWVDFVEWYHQSLIDFAAGVAREAMKYFPAEQLKVKPGGSAGGVNPIAWGTYCPGYAKALGKEFGRRPIRLQPADCHGRPFGDRWYGTAYRFYGTPLTTEPAGNLDRKGFLRRVFMDACNGASEMFTYEWDLHKEDARKWIHLYRGIASTTDVAVLCPTTWYRMNGDVWPAIRTADSLRDVTDFEVADELLVKDDYLQKSRTRVLIWTHGPVTERVVLAKVLDWVEAGGILVAGMSSAPTDVEGRDDLGSRLFGDGSKAFNFVGKGLVLRYPSEAEPGDAGFRRLVVDAVYHPERYRPGLKGTSEIDGVADGVWTAAFPDRLLMFNNSDKPATVIRKWRGREMQVELQPGTLWESGSE